MIQIEFNQEKIELPQECSVADFIKDNPNKQNVWVLIRVKVNLSYQKYFAKRMVF